jgi:glutaredoxin
MKNAIVLVAFVAAAFLAYQYVFNPSTDENMIFTLNDCELCETAIALLDAYEIEYTEYNVDESDENVTLFKKYKGRRLPLIFIDGERLEPANETFLNIAINGLFESDNNEVAVYTRPGCGWCVKTVEYFQDNNIAFTEYDITESDVYHSRFLALGGHGVPFIVIGDNLIGGFNQEAFRMALKQIGLM